MIWKVWRGFKAVGSAVGRTIFWCNRADEAHEITADNASARIFSECGQAIGRHLVPPTNQQPRVKIWRESFSKLCLASRAGRRPILALVLREESDAHAQQAAKFLNDAQDSAINELLQAEFVLVAFTMSNPPIGELGNIFKMGQSDLSLIFAHVTHTRSL